MCRAKRYEEMRNAGGSFQTVSSHNNKRRRKSNFESNKSTKGASKLRRDLINSEIANLRDLLPLPSSTRQRLSQLQLMALVCVYVRKANYFQQVFKRHQELGPPFCTPNIGFSKALSGFLIMMTQNGKLLYISDNAAEYLGHSMEDLLIHGDSVYDIIDKADHGTVQAELLRSSNAHNPPGEDTRLFLCRMNVSRNARRQMRFGDQKVVLLRGHFLSYLPLCSRNEPVFVAQCTPVAMPETRECVVQGATNVFTSIHQLDMKFINIDRNGEHYLGYKRGELAGISWYQLIHWNYMREAQSKHRLISGSDQEKSCILLLRLRTRSGDWVWVHCVLQVKDGQDSNQTQQSVIVATNQVLSEREAAVMRANAWIYHYYTVQTKLQYGLAYPEAVGGGPTSPTTAAARLAAAAAYFPPSKLINYPQAQHHHHLIHPHHHPHHHHQPHAPHHPISPESAGGYSPAMAPPSLQSPHSNGSSSFSTSYHLPSPTTTAGTTAFDVRTGKESPLDFSISSVYEFPGGYPGSPYWNPHHHYHPHPHHGFLNQRAEDGSSGLATTVAASASSPHGWSALLPGGTNLTHSPTHNSHHHANNNQNHHQQQQQQPTHHQAAVNNNNNNRTLITNLSPSSVLIPAPKSSNNKRMRKISPESLGEMMSEMSHSNGNNAATVRNSLEDSHVLVSDVGGSLRRGSLMSGTAELLTMVTPFSHHTRPRKVLSSTASEDEQVSAAEEESMTMTCPLTPSPIWEGQAHRVPDLQLYSSGDSRERQNGQGNAGGDLIHCVPTYEQVTATYPSSLCYPPPNSSSSAGVMMVSNHVTTSMMTLCGKGRDSNKSTSE